MFVFVFVFVFVFGFVFGCVFGFGARITLGGGGMRHAVGEHEPG
jgi:hypothetical protein